MPLVTLGALLKSAVLMALAARLPSTCLGRISRTACRARNGAHVLFILKTTVCGSGAVMLCTCSSRSERRGEFTSLYSGANIRLNVKRTSSLVSGWPSDHFRLDRSLNVYVVPSDDAWGNDWASRGTRSPFGLLPIRPSNSIEMTWLLAVSEDRTEFM